MGHPVWKVSNKQWYETNLVQLRKARYRAKTSGDWARVECLEQETANLKYGRKCYLEAEDASKELRKNATAEDEDLVKEDSDFIELYF